MFAVDKLLKMIEDRNMVITFDDSFTSAKRKRKQKAGQKDRVAEISQKIFCMLEVKKKKNR